MSNVADSKILRAHLDLIPEPVREVLGLFQSHDERLRFPGVDAEILAHAVQALSEQAEIVTSAAEALEFARVALQEKQQAASDLTQKAHRYASVYAEDDPELRRKISQVKIGSLGRAAKKRKPRPAVQKGGLSVSKQPSSERAKSAQNSEASDSPEEEDCVAAE